jgi:hypothetical protein
MKPLIFIAFLLTAFTTEKSLTSSAELSCVLTSDKKVYKVGELPKFTVDISNNSNSDIYLIGSLDGSDVKWRFPYCYYTIDRPKPDTTRLQRCGNMNTLRVADFKLVKAGQKFNPYESIDGYGFFTDYTTTNQETFKNPGVYKIKFHYSTNSQNISDFTGDRPFRSDRSDSMTINSFFKKLPKVEIISNEIEIRVEE